MSRIEYRTQVPASMHRVWALIADPGRLPQLCPPHRHVEVEARHGGLLRGSLVFLSFSFFRRRFRWASVIEAIEPPQRMVETMHEGPLALWRHEIQLHATSWGTEMTESVEYLPRWGIAGRMVDLLLLRRVLEQIFLYRQSRLLELLASEKPPESKVPSAPLETGGVAAPTLRN